MAFNLDCTLGGVSITGQTTPFIENLLEGSSDIVTLGGVQYTDFLYQRRGWTISYEVLNEADYDAIRAVYDLQFSDYEYPNFTCVYYDVVNSPVRMYLNNKIIEKDGCRIRKIEIKVIERSPIYGGVVS